MPDPYGLIRNIAQMGLLPRKPLILIAPNDAGLEISFETRGTRKKLPHSTHSNHKSREIVMESSIRVKIEKGTEVEL